MLGDHHSLVNEFPEYRDRIHELKMNDTQFSQSLEQYDAIDKEIFRIEEQIENTSGEYLEELKYKRVKLKDDLYFRLKSTDE